MSTLVGMQLNGRYRLDAQIGSGGMSTVYRALDQTLERRVAVKLMHREIASDSDQLERFRREARSVAQLSHPHIVGVIDAGEDEGRPYIVFEYVDGETLKERIRRLGRLPMDEAIAYAIEIARALGCAHSHHIVHRDVKPQNVLIDDEGSAKVTDFGIARTLDQEGLTADGRVLGTTDYVSPEQALGHDVNGQSDIYSLGVVLFEMLTGDVPFHGENQVSVAMKHVREDLPDLQARRPEASATLASVLDRMTDKDLGRRYPDVPTLIADLEEALAIEAARSGKSTGEATAVLRTLPESTRRRLPFRMRHPLPVLGVIALLAVATVIIVLVVQQGAERTDARHRRGHDRGGAERARRLRRQRVGARLRPARGRGGARRRDAAGGRPPARHHLEHRGLPRRPGGRRQGRRRPLPRRAARRRGRPDGDPERRARLDGGDLRRAARAACRRASRTAGRASAAARCAAPTSASGSTPRGERYRYYLVWITELPPDTERVEIGELALFERAQPLRSERVRPSARPRSARARTRPAGRRAPARPRRRPPTASGRRWSR